MSSVIWNISYLLPVINELLILLQKIFFSKNIVLFRILYVRVLVFSSVVQTLQQRHSGLFASLQAQG